MCKSVMVSRWIFKATVFFRVYYIYETVKNGKTCGQSTLNLKYVSAFYTTFA
jgi:hypothetical protein